MSNRSNKNQDPIIDNDSPILNDGEKNKKTTYTPKIEKTRRKANK